MVNHPEDRTTCGFEANIHLVPATIVMGNGGMDHSDFAAILDLPQASSFRKCAFNRIKSMIGINNLQEVIKVSMNETLQKEAKMMFEDFEQITKNAKKYLSNTEKNTTYRQF